jgi:hypothetical protein
MEKKYYIYEIPGVKIGCAWNVKRRVKGQGYTNYKILEHHNDIMEASKREIELQRKYGYKVDKIPYYKSVSNFTTEGCRKAGKISGKKNVESGHIASLGKKYGKINGKKAAESGQLASIASLGGKIGGKKNKESGQIAALGKANKKLTFEQAQEIREKFHKMDGGKYVRYNALAAHYNVSNTAIQNIIKNKTYTEK